jgi:hypothetical protein
MLDYGDDLRFTHNIDSDWSTFGWNKELCIITSHYLL